MLLFVCCCNFCAVPPTNRQQWQCYQMLCLTGYSKFGMLCLLFLSWCKILFIKIKVFFGSNKSMKARGSTKDLKHLSSESTLKIYIPIFWVFEEIPECPFKSLLAYFSALFHAFSARIPNFICFLDTFSM